MNKKFSTLLAVLGLAASSTAMAQGIVEGDYYYLEANLGTQQKAHLILSEETADGKPALFGIYAGGGGATPSELATSDSALWKIEYTRDNVSGAYSYVFKNKATGTQLSFDAKSNVAPTAAASIYNGGTALTGHGTKLGAALTGSMEFSWGTNLMQEKGTATVLSSYITSEDSTLTLAFSGLANNLEYSVTTPVELYQVKVKGKPTNLSAGTSNNPIVAVKPVRAQKRALTVKELNNKLGEDRGFQLFFNYNDELTEENNPLANVIFEAEAASSTQDTAVYLKAKTITPKDGKALYAYLDTVSYSAVTNLPSDGSRMTFKVDTFPTTNGEEAIATNIVLPDGARTFNFFVDPSSANDSVAVYVRASYNLVNGTRVAPHKYAVLPASGNAGYALQIDKLAGTTSDEYILTTRAGITESGTAGRESELMTTALAKETRISFTGEAIAPIFDATKVYSVKYVNKRTGDDKAGKYLAYGVTSATTWGTTYADAAYTHLPSTQFVFDGSQMINREAAGIKTNALYVVKDEDGEVIANTYTNLSDTLEIVAMDVNLNDTTIGWANFDKDSLINYAFSLDYLSGILEGRSININADSVISAIEGEGMLFKLKAGALVKVNGCAEIEEVKPIYNQTYQFLTKDEKSCIVADGEKLALVPYVTGTTPTSFYLRDTETEGEYILLPVANDAKYNVNSTDETLERVALTLTNNAFAVQVEPAPAYVLDAHGHYNIATARGDMLAADSEGFGMLRREGDLKADYVADDFALWVDTAKIHATEPSYFILSGATVGENGELAGNFLRVMEDSANVEGYKAANGMTRLAFVPAKREAGATSDSLLVNYQNETLTKADSVDYKGKNTGKIAQFQFKFQYTNVDGEYLVESAMDANHNYYLASYNEVLCLTKAGEEQALVVRLEPTDAPTANDEISTSEVKVIAGDGQITISGAAGKKVVVSNILGQVVANTVITSDNATIAAPQGVVVVAVEGEEAVKAIVK